MPLWLYSAAVVRELLLTPSQRPLHTAIKQQTMEKRAKDKVDLVEFSHAVPHMTSLPFFISEEGPVLIHRRVVTRLISSLAVSPVWARDTDAQRITNIRHKG
jgi:hypothetical protein